MSRRLGCRAALAAGLAALVPGAAHACAVCNTPGGGSASAFFWMTIFLSLLPLSVIAAGVIWLARNAREYLAGEFVERHSVPVVEALNVPAVRDAFDVRGAEPGA